MTSTITRITAILAAAGLLCGVVGAGQAAADPAPDSGQQCDLPSVLGAACNGLHNALKNVVGGTTGELANSIFGSVVKSLLGGLTQVLEWCLDWSKNARRFRHSRKRRQSGRFALSGEG